MSEELQDRRLEEQMDVGGTADDVSKSGNLNIRYTRASLLEFNEAELCRNLPGDFDMLVLRQLDGPSKCLTEYGEVPCRSSERNNIMCQHLPSELGCNAGILGPKTSRSDLFQLRKSENPYRPPHCIKKMPQLSDNSSKLQVECLQNNSSSDPSASSLDDSWRYGKGSGRIDPKFELEIIDDDDSWRYGKGSGRIDPKFELEIIDDDKLFDDLWAEILEIIEWQQGPKLSPDAARDVPPDSEVRKGSLVLTDGTKSETLNFITPDNDDLVRSEGEINLPDEDSLISIDDIMVVPPMPTPMLDWMHCVEADKGTSNAVVNPRNNSESFYVPKPDDRLMALSFLGQVSREQLFTLLPHSQASDIFGLDKSSLHLRNDQMSLLSEITTPNNIPYLPTLDWYSCSDFHHRCDKETIRTSTNTKDSLVQYSLWQQPNIICPEQLNNLLIDTYPMRPVAIPDLNAMQPLPLTLQQTTFQGIRLPAAGGIIGNPDASSFWYNQR